MTFKFKKIILLGSILSCTAAYSQNPLSKFGNYQANEMWGMGGCGVGSLFIKQRDMLPQVGASVVNFYLGATQTFAITSGSSNCVAEKNNLASVEQEVYIIANLSSLSKEAAQGGGDHIAALAEVFGCPSEAFMKMSQENYGKIFNTSNPNEVLKNYISEVKVSESLSDKCIRVI